MEKNNSNFSLMEWPALNVVKFVCVAVMVFVHAHMMLITNRFYAISDTSGFFYKVTSDFMFVGLFVFILPIIAGAIFRMSLVEHLSGGKLKNYSFKKVINIAIFLALVGFFMNILIAGPFYVFSWNVLQLMGLSLVIITSLLKIFSVEAVFLFGAFALLAAAPLRNILGSWGNHYFVGILIGGSKGFIFWPFFPWFSVVAFGFLFAHYYLKYEDDIKFRLAALGTGILFLAIAIFRGEVSPYLDPKYVWGASLFEPKTGFVLAAMGLFCVLTVGANYFFNGIKLKKYGIINSYSKGILWIYVIQMLLNYKFAAVVKGYFPMDKPSAAYFILPAGVLLACWLIGMFSIKFLQEKLIVVRLKKINEK